MMFSVTISSKTYSMVLGLYDVLPPNPQIKSPWKYSFSSREIVQTVDKNECHPLVDDQSEWMTSFLV